MKLVKNFVFVAVLVSSFAFNAFAGDIDMPGKPAITRDDETIMVSDYNTQQTEVTVETSDYLLFEALAALLSV